MKKIFLAILALSLASPALSETIGPYKIDKKDIVGTGPYAPRDPAFRNDGTLPHFRVYFYRRTGAKLGVCVKTKRQVGQRDMFYGAMPTKQCVAWIIAEGNGPYVTGQVFEPR